jgi:hypothetical protein
MWDTGDMHTGFVGEILGKRPPGKTRCIGGVFENGSSRNGLGRHALD